MCVKTKKIDLATVLFLFSLNSKKNLYLLRPPDLINSGALISMHDIRADRKNSL